MNDTRSDRNSDNPGLLSADGLIDLVGEQAGAHPHLSIPATRPSETLGDAWTADRHRRRTLPPTDGGGVGPRLTVPVPPPPARISSIAPNTGGSRRMTSDGPPAPDIHDEVADLYALGDYAGALCAAELLLGSDPNDEVAQYYAAGSREGLEAFYVAKFGSLDRVYSLRVQTSELQWLGLDPQALRLVPLLDGVRSLHEVVEMADLERLATLKVAVELLDAGAIAHTG